MVTRHARLVAERGPQLGAATGGVGVRRRLRIGQNADHCAACTPLDQRAQQTGGVAGASAARVVLGVGKNDRTPRIPGTAQGFRHRLLRGVELTPELRLAGNELGQQGFGGPLCGALRAAVGHHRGTRLGDVGEWESAGQPERRDLAVDQLGEAPVQPAGRLVQGAAPIERNEEIGTPQGLVPTGSAGDQCVQVVRSARSGQSHIHMRIGAVDVQRVRVRQHCGRDVGMQIQAGDHRHRRAHRRPHAAQNLPVPVLQVLAHHRPVQVQVYAVHRHRPCESVQ